MMDSMFEHRSEVMSDEKVVYMCVCVHGKEYMVNVVCL
jgi:hypothetical protein